MEARPRFAAEDDASSRALILAFDAEVEAEAQHERAQISSALNFEFSLLARHPCARPTMCSLVSHTFFAGIDVRTCHARPAMPLGHGCRGTAPVQCSAAADPAWAQRQYSLIWAPVVSATVGGAKTVENNVESCIGGVVIPQSDEEDISAPFLPVVVH